MYPNMIQMEKIIMFVCVFLCFVFVIYYIDSL